LLNMASNLLTEISLSVCPRDKKILVPSWMRFRETLSVSDREQASASCQGAPNRLGFRLGRESRHFLT
jgi:hypothetical protein